MFKKMILIVDDDIEITELLSAFVQYLGYKSVVKYNAISALKWLSQIKPDLILLDIMLPDMTGIEICKWLSENEAYRNIPLIHMSGYMKDDAARINSMISGANNFIAKPIDFNLLNFKIQTLIGDDKKVETPA